MKIIHIVLLFFVATFIISCNSEPTFEPTATSFSGKIVGAENQKIFIRKETLNSNFLDTISVNLDGSFSYDFIIDKPNYFTFFVGRNQVILYLKPGDSLKLSADVQMFDDLKFSGSSVVYNEYLAKFAKSQGEFASTMQEVFSRDEVSAVKVMDSLKTFHMNGLQEFEKSFSKIDKYFLETEKQRIRYFWGLSHVMYPMYFAYYNQLEDFKVSANFDAYLGELNINDSNLLSLPEYRQFITNYLTSKVNDYYKSPDLMKKQPSFTAYQLFIIKSLFTDRNIQSYLSYRILKDHVSYEGIKDYEIIYPIFKELCITESFIKEIDTDFSAWETLKKGMPSKDFVGVNIKGDSIRLSDFKGKYVYVDVWATWCNPCLGEIPSLLEVERKLEGKNIVFLGVSVDRDKAAWEKMVKESKLAGTQIYVGLNENLSVFYKISGIPRFMMFDKEGKILEVSADRPSSGVDQKILELEGI